MTSGRNLSEATPSNQRNSDEIQLVSESGYHVDQEGPPVSFLALTVPTDSCLTPSPDARSSFINTKEGDYSTYFPLYQAALQGNWLDAKAFIEANDDALTARINEYSETALHVAAGAGRSSKLTFFIEELVKTMPREALEYRDLFGRTPLGAAVWVGNTEAVKVLWEASKSSQYIKAQLWSALYMVARNAMKDILEFLLEVSEKFLLELSEKFLLELKNNKNENEVDEKFLLEIGEKYRFSVLFPIDDSAAHFLILVIASGYYDIALNLVEKYPRLATSIRVNGDCGLKALAKQVSAFKSGSNYNWWQRIIYKLSPQATRQRNNWALQLKECFCTYVPYIKDIQGQKKMHLQALKLLKRLCAEVKALENSHDLYAKDAILTAAKLGIHEVMEEIVKLFPNLIWAEDEKSLNLFQIAVEERHANVFNQIYQMGANQQLLVQMKDPCENNLLHLAGKLAPQNKNVLVIGAALQMQRDLQWFEEVKSFANPRDMDWLNKDKKTPRMLFTEQHEKLRAQGEEWMKHTANSCTIPTALIVTVVFAAAITVPGGLDTSGDGLPVFSKEVVFNIFAVFNAISLCAAITSLLMSLSILTSRYAHDEFLFALPNKLVIALVTLYLSIIAMAVAFSSALYIMFGSRNKPLILCLVVAVAFIPIISFAFLEFHLLLDLMVSTYRPRIFGKQSNQQNIKNLPILRLLLFRRLQ